MHEKMNCHLDRIFTLTLLVAFFLSTAYSAPPHYSIKGGVGSGKQRKGRMANPIRSTNKGVDKQLIKLERFVELHKDVHQSNLDPITKAKRIKKLEQVQERLDQLNQRQSNKKSVQAEKSDSKKNNQNRPSSGSPTKSITPTKSLQNHPDSSSSIDGAKKPTPDSIMSKHFGGWRSPNLAPAISN